MSSKCSSSTTNTTSYLTKFLPRTLIPGPFHPSDIDPYSLAFSLACFNLTCTNEPLSPLAQKMTCIYLSALTPLRYLQIRMTSHEDVDGEKEKRGLLLECKEYERACLGLPEHGDGKQRGLWETMPEYDDYVAQTELLKIRRLQLLSRYGAWVENLRIFDPIRKTAAYTEGVGWKLRNPHKWTSNSERTAFWIECLSGWDADQHRRTGVDENYRQHLTICNAATHLGLPDHAACTLVREYNNNYGFLTNDIPSMIAELQYLKLAQTLHQDLRDLTVVMPIQWHAEEILLWHFLNALISLWFDRRGCDLDRPETWRPVSWLSELTLATQIGTWEGMLDTELVLANAYAECSLRYESKTLETATMVYGRHAEEYEGADKWTAVGFCGDVRKRTWKCLEGLRGREEMRGVRWRSRVNLWAIVGATVERLRGMPVEHANLLAGVEDEECDEDGIVEEGHVFKAEAVVEKSEPLEHVNGEFCEQYREIEEVCAATASEK